MTLKFFKFNDFPGFASSIVGVASVAAVLLEASSAPAFATDTTELLRGLLEFKGGSCLSEYTPNYKVSAVEVAPETFGFEVVFYGTCDGRHFCSTGGCDQYLIIGPQIFDITGAGLTELEAPSREWLGVNTLGWHCGRTGADKVGYKSTPCKFLVRWEPYTENHLPNCGEFIGSGAKFINEIYLDASTCAPDQTSDAKGAGK